MFKELESKGYIINSEGTITGVRFGRPLQPNTIKGGYRQINVGSKMYLVHLLVAYKFLGQPPSDKHYINHKDSDPSNNDSGNLEWVTHQQNIMHSYGHTDYMEVENKIANARSLSASGMTQRKIAAHLGVSQKTISNWLK